jgi:hypothetical protein
MAASTKAVASSNSIHEVRVVGYIMSTKGVAKPTKRIEQRVAPGRGRMSQNLQRVRRGDWCSSAAWGCGRSAALCRRDIIAFGLPKKTPSSAAIVCAASFASRLGEGPGGWLIATARVAAVT